MLSSTAARGLMAAAGLVFVLVGAGPAAAAPAAPGASLTGCSASATATNSSGAPVSQLTAPGASGASPSNPFVVDLFGTVTYHGQSDATITDHHWQVKVDGITVASGGSANARKVREASGTVSVRRYLPIRVTGLYHVSGGIKGTGGACDGSVWVRLGGNPVTTAPFWTAIAFVVLGLAGLLWSRPSVPSTYPGASA
jgi:hypothetical protein